MKVLPKFFAGILTGIVLTVGITTGGWAGDTLQKISVAIRPLHYYFNGELNENTDGWYFNGVKNVPLGLNYEGTTYVPLRFLAEGLGQEVGYDGQNNLIWIGTPPVSNQENSVDSSKDISLAGKTAENYLGMETGELIKILGEPQRKDPGEFGFDWWIYNRDYRNYLQVGVKEDTVVALYTNSRNWSTANLKIGTKRETVVKQLNLSQEVQAKYNNATYNFSVPSETFQMKALKVDGNVATELFFDLHDQKQLTAVQVTQLSTFLNTDFNYSTRITYSGSNPLPEKPRLSPGDREAVARAYEQQLFDLVNSVRVQRDLPPLKWNDTAATVARSHSNDMLTNNFFSHTSPNTGSMGDRLQKAGIPYRSAGENIAYGQSDSINAHESWMNSLGHRQNILNKDFQTLGVGVAGKYYTQNFVTY